MSKKEIQRQQSTNSILDAAMALFSEQGFDCTSIRQIAVKAKISLGLLYNYFPSKEAVLLAILEKGWQDVAAAIALPPGLTPLQELEHHVRATLQAVEMNRDFWRLYYSLRLQSGIVKELDNQRKGQTQQLLGRLTKCLAEAGSTSPSAEAKLLTASIDGIAVQYLASPEYPLQDVVIRYLVQLKNHLAN